MSEKQEIPENTPPTPFLKRAGLIEKELIENKPLVEYDLRPDGASIKVIFSINEIPIELRSKEKHEKERIAIYVPTLWYTNSKNQEASAREIRLTSGLLAGTVDSVIRLKAEGMNDMAYKDEDGKPRGQSKVAESAVSILKQQLEKAGKKLDDIEFYILGYSEGSSQGASIAAKLAEQGLTVKEYVSIGGGGMIGAENQSNAKPVSFAGEAIKTASNKPVEPEGEKIAVEGLTKTHTVIINQGPDAYYLPAEIIAGIDQSLGKAKYLPPQIALEPEVEFAGRYAATRIGLSANPIPNERLRAAATKNPDYQALVRNNIPIIFFAEQKDTFFDAKKTLPAIAKLKAENPNAKIVTITSDSGHDDPWKNPGGMAYVMEIVRRKSGLN